MVRWLCVRARRSVLSCVCVAFCRSITDHGSCAVAVMLLVYCRLIKETRVLSRKTNAEVFVAFLLLAGTMDMRRHISPFRDAYKDDTISKLKEANRVRRQT